MTKDDIIFFEDKTILHKYKVFKYETGYLKLLGWQASRIRKKKVIFHNCFMININNELFLKNVNFNEKGSHNIKILFPKQKIFKLNKMIKTKGMNIVFYQLISINNFFSIKFIIGKGLKKYDIRYKEKQKIVFRKIKRKEKKYNKQK